MEEEDEKEEKDVKEEAGEFFESFIFDIFDDTGFFFDLSKHSKTFGADFVVVAVLWLGPQPLPMFLSV